jgi:hypothetical protein
MIHHISIPARQPRAVAEALACFWNAEVLPFPMYEGSYIVFSGDDHGSSIEIYPDGHVLQPSTPELPALVPSTAVANSGFHAAISVPVDRATIERECAARGWTCQTGPRGPFFHVVEVWVENHTLLELLPPEMAGEYRAFASPQRWKAVFGEAAAQAS